MFLELRKNAATYRLCSNYNTDSDDLGSLAANLIAKDVFELKFAANVSHSDVILKSIERLQLLSIVKSNERIYLHYKPG
jgi:hypothetical protein